MIELYFDGLCKPTNPGGVACFGWLLKRGGLVLASGGGEAARGPGATNNLAEYHALLAGLEAAAGAAGPGELVTAHGDSQLVIRQMTGEYSVSAPNLVPLHLQARVLAGKLPDVAYEWIPRERNAEADKLSNEAYDVATGAASKMCQPMRVMTSHQSVEYYTPAQFVEAARQVMGGIDLDPASCPTAQATIKAAAFYTEADNGLALAWSGRVWLNPPYSIGGAGSNQSTWSKKLVKEYLAGNVKEAVLLVKAALGYKWFEELFARWPVCFVRDRIAFIKPDGTSDGPAKQGTAFFYFGPNAETFKAIYSRFGRVIMPEVENANKCQHGYQRGAALALCGAGPSGA